MIILDLRPWYTTTLTSPICFCLRVVLSRAITLAGVYFFRFIGMNKLKRVALNVIAQQLSEAQIGNMREVFIWLHRISVEDMASMTERYSDTLIGCTMQLHICERRQAFIKMDKDGDGEITIDELEQTLKEAGLETLEYEAERLIHGIDINGNNTLDYREFLAATMKRRLFIEVRGRGWLDEAMMVSHDCFKPSLTLYFFLFNAGGEYESSICLF